MRVRRAPRHVAAGVVVSAGLAEIVVMATALRVLPAGSLDPRLLLDVGRALLAAAGALAAVRLLPPLPLAAGMAVCIGAYALLALAVRLVSLAELRSFVPDRWGRALEES